MMDFYYFKITVVASKDNYKSSCSVGLLLAIFDDIVKQIPLVQNTKYAGKEISEQTWVYNGCQSMYRVAS